MKVEDTVTAACAPKDAVIDPVWVEHYASQN